MAGTGDPGRAAARGTLQLALAQVCAMACGYVVVVVLARGLGPERYGVYGVVLSVLLAVELIGRFGIPQAVAKLVAEEGAHSRALERTGVTLTALTFVAIGAGFWVAAPWTARVLRLPDGTALLRLAGLDIPFYGMYFMCEHVLNGRRRFGVESTGIALYGLSKAAGVLLLLATGMSVEAALVANIAASVVALGYLAVRLEGTVFRPSLEAARAVLDLALPVGLFALGAELLIHLDLWCLKALGADADRTGFYVSALRLASLPGAVQFVMMAVLVPTVARALAAGDRELALQLVRGAVRFLVLALTPVVLLVAASSRDLMTLVYSAAYADGGPLLAVHVFRLGFFQVIMITFCAILIASGRLRGVVVLVLGSLLPALALDVACIRAAGAAGAAAAALATWALAAGGAAGLVAARLGRLITIRTLLRTGLAAAVLLAVAYLVPARGPWLIAEYLLAMLAYGLVLWGSRELTAADLQLLERRAPAGTPREVS